MDQLEIIATEDLAGVGGGLNLGALFQGIGSIFGQQGEAIGAQFGQIGSAIQNLIAMFRGIGQPQAGQGAEAQQASQGGSMQMPQAGQG